MTITGYYTQGLAFRKPVPPRYSLPCFPSIISMVHAKPAKGSDLWLFVILMNWSHSLKSQLHRVQWMDQKPAGFMVIRYGQYVSYGPKQQVSNTGLISQNPGKNWTRHQQILSLFGTGEEIYDVTWNFKRDKRTGEHHFKGKWIGFVNLVQFGVWKETCRSQGEEMLAWWKWSFVLHAREWSWIRKLFFYKINGF